MHTQADKKEENKSQVVANGSSQKQSSSESAFQFLDNRPVAVVQRKLQELASNQPGAKQAIIERKAVIQQQARGHLGLSVQAPIQLRKFKDAEIRRIVKKAAENSPPNSTAILLAIYNEMRHEIDPTPVVFTTLAAARNALIAANRMDAEDADFFAGEAARMQQAGGDPAEALRLRIVSEIADKRAAIEGKYGHHIFQGDINQHGIPTGFHSKVDGSATHEAYGNATNVNNVGAYQQSVRRRDNGVHKPIQSTFFPDAATHQHVIDAVTVVYGCGLSTVAYVDGTVNGMRLAKKGDTVFPAGGSDGRLAE